MFFLGSQWRYSTWSERLATVLGSLSGCLCSAGLVAAVLIYGELTALFITRHKAEHSTGHAYILSIFGGNRIVDDSNRTFHMDALVEDSVAFAVASFAIMACQLVAAACAVTLANWAAGRMITRLRWKLLRSVLSQETAFFDTNTTMNFASTLTEDTEKLKMGVGEHVAMASYLAGSVIMACSVALAHGWQLTLAGLAVVPVALFVAATVAKSADRPPRHISQEALFKIPQTILIFRVEMHTPLSTSMNNPDAVLSMMTASLG
ncbi:jg6491 [Pararge aegeria aegeria]|uniref:Jg6491 protein n=1 Tax=Pararge aegeria aegeria TaxID=348720 RepID=A0A8S4SPI4_9NEOP|nr:jg6491 [Pararge aegeria aegeria]